MCKSQQIPLLKVSYSQTFVLLGKTEGRIPKTQHTHTHRKPHSVVVRAALLASLQHLSLLAPGLNEELVQLLLMRDELHMEQDAMLVDIEDLTRWLSAQLWFMICVWSSHTKKVTNIKKRTCPDVNEYLTIFQLSTSCPFVPAEWVKR